MKRFAASLVVACSLGSLLIVDSAIAEAPSVRQFVEIKWPRSGNLAPGGEFYFIHNPDGLFQLYVRKGGDERKLTDFPDGVQGYSLSDDGKWIAISAAIGGNEQADIYLFETSTGRMRALYAHPDVVFGSVVWRRDSKAFAFKANDISPSDFYVYVYDLASNSTRRVLSQPGDTSPVDFNSTGDRLMTMRYNSASHSQLFEVNLNDGKNREVTPAGEEWAFKPVGYTAKNDAFIAISNYKGDKNTLARIDLESGEVSPFLPELAEFETDFGVFNDNRSLLAVGLNEDGYGTLKLYALGKKNATKEMPTPAMPKGIVGNVAFCGGDMLYSIDNAQNPGLIYRWSPAVPTASAVALTEADTRGIDLAKYPLPELIKYKSFDGLEVPAFIYLPPDYKKGSRIPFIVSYHGGPEGQYRPNFNYLNSYFASRGFGVLAPNVRGSSGYGMKYLEMDNYKKRMGSVKDGIEAAKWLVAEGYSSPSQIAAFGGSYGGFMVMATITEAPEIFGAACNIVGICNMQTFLERTKDYRRKLREAEYGPLEDTEFLRSISPIYKVDRINCPLMIAHGANDPRVPLHEAEQLEAKMKKLGKPVEMLVFPDEGHGFRKENNRIEFAERVTEFFSKNLKP